jgi:hypothetical protein
VQQCLLSMPTIIIAPLALVWLVSHPDYRVSTEESKENGSVVSDVIMTEESDDSKNNLFTSSNSDWANKNPSSGSSLPLRDLVFERLQKPLTKQGLLPKLKSTTLLSSHKRPSARPKPSKAKACVRGKEVPEVVTFRGSPPTDPHVKWVGQQDATEIPNGGRLLEAPLGFPDRLLVIEDD